MGHNALKLAIAHIKSFIKCGWVEKWRNEAPSAVNRMVILKKDTPQVQKQRWRVVVDGRQSNALGLPGALMQLTP